MNEPNAPRALTMPRLAGFLAIGVVVLMTAHVLDPVAYEHIFSKRAGRSDLWRLLRSMGYMPLWLGVGVLFLTDDTRRFRLSGPAHLVNRWSRSVFVVLGAALSGLAAEAVKLASRRERPPEEGWAGLFTSGEMSAAAGYTFDWPTAQPFSSSGIGFVSSHTAVAFGAALALGLLHPRYRTVLLMLAAGCALQRVAARAHFLSDVAGALLVALAVTAMLWRGHWAVLRRHRYRARVGRTTASPGTAEHPAGTDRV